MSDNYGIKPEWWEAWRDVYQIYPWKLLADLSAHLLAKLMESEFMREHTHCRAQQIVMFNPDRTFIEWYNGNESCHDPRHDYSDDDWLREAREELGK